jgi:uncharacterized protein
MRGLHLVVLFCTVWIAACSTSIKRENPGAAVGSGKMPVPQLTGRINDTVNLLSTADLERLSNLLKGYQQETGHQIAVLIVPALGAEAIESFCLRSAKAWRPGSQGCR